MKEVKKFNIVACSGTPHEIGQQYGSACRENIHKSLEGLIEGISSRNKVHRPEVLAVARKYLSKIASFDPDMIEMLKGEAEGAKLSFDEVLALRCGTELNFYYQRLTTLCTTIVVRGKATRGGKTLIGQTYDFSSGTTLDLVKRKFPDGLQQLSLVVGSGIGGEVLINSAGLAMALNVVIGPAREQLINVPFACVIPRAMRQKRIGDALGVVCASGRSILHYAFASAEGDIIGIETWPDDYNVIYPERDMLVHTNHSLTERFKRGESAFGFMEGDSHIRLQRVKKLIEDHYGEITPEKMMDFMCDHTDFPRSICKHVADGINMGETLSAIVMEPAEKVMYISYGQPCCNEYVKYTL